MHMFRETAGVWPVDVTAGDVRYPPGGTFGPRVQPFVQLVLLHSGSMTVWVDGVPRRVGSARVAVLLPGHAERFAFAETEETFHSWMHADIPALPAGLRARLEELPWSIPLSPAMAELQRQAIGLRATSLPTAHALRITIGAQMLWRYIGEAEQQAAGQVAGDHPAIERARQFIDAHLDEPCNLTTIAAAAAISPAHLVRLFRARLGTTPIAYLWQRRVARGVELLTDTGLPIGMIAERCGFQTSYHFSRKIHAATGKAPRTLRLQGRA